MRKNYFLRGIGIICLAGTIYLGINGYQIYDSLANLTSGMDKIRRSPLGTELSRIVREGESEKNSPLILRNLEDVRSYESRRDSIKIVNWQRFIGLYKSQLSIGALKTKEMQGKEYGK